MRRNFHMRRNFCRNRHSRHNRHNRRNRRMDHTHKRLRQLQLPKKTKCWFCSLIGVI